MARFGNTPQEPAAPEGLIEDATPPIPLPVEHVDPTSLEVSDDDLRGVITNMGFNYDDLSEDDREFVRESEGERRARQAERAQLTGPPGAQGDAHPLIPTSDDEIPPPTTPEPTSSVVPGAPSADDGLDTHGQHDPSGGSGVPDPSSRGEGGADGSPALPPVAESFVVHTAQGDVALPRNVIESAVALQSQISQEEIAMINAIRNGLMTPVFVDPQTRQPVVPAQAPAPNVAPEPWVDEQAQQAFGTIEGQIGALSDEMAQVRDIIMARQQNEMINAMDGGIERFAASHGFAIENGQPDQGLTRVLSQLEAMNILPVFGQQYPGDPGTAIEKALDAVYWSIPEFREAHFEGRVHEHVEETRTVEEKKQNNASIATTPGSSPRETPTFQRGMTREEQVNRMAEFIANSRTPVGS